MIPMDHDAAKNARDEALAWFVKLSSGHAVEEDYDAHRAWISADAANADEYAKLRGMWKDFDQLKDPRSFPIKSRTNSKTISRRLFMSGGAAGLTAAGAALVFGLPDIVTGAISSGVGELRSLTLDDGSSAELDADTAIKLSYTVQERRLTLLKGRAYFSVAKDPSRPFIVETNFGQTTALGTRFTVHQQDDSAIVSVEESAVAVEQGHGNRVVVSAGEFITYNESQTSQVQPIVIDDAFAWRRGKLIFEDRPLAQVISDINRYRRGIIKVSDSRLLDLRVSGIFDLRQPEGVLDALVATLPINATYLTSYLVVLSPA